MALQFGSIQIQLGGGLAENVSDPNVGNGKALAASNAWIRKAGSYEIRPGFRDVPDTVAWPVGHADIATGYALTPDGDGLLLSDKRHVYAWIAKLAKWHEIDDVYEAQVSRHIQGERGMAAINEMGDAVYCNGYYVYAWISTESGAAKGYVRVVDRSTGTSANLFSWTLLTAAYQSGVRLCVHGNKVYIVYLDTNVCVRVLDTTMLTSGLSGASTIGNYASTVGTASFDAAMGETHLYLVYAYNRGLGAGEQCRLVMLNTSTWVMDGGENLFGTLPNRLAIGVGDVVWTARWDNAAETVIIHSMTTLDCSDSSGDDDLHFASWDDVRRIGIGVSTDGSKALVAFSGTVGTKDSVYAREVSWMGVKGDGVITPNVSHLTRPIYWDSSWYVVEWFATSYQRFGWLCELVLGPNSDGSFSDDRSRVVCRVATHAFYGCDAGSSYTRIPPNLAQVSTDVFVAPIPMKSETLDGASEGFDLFEFTFAARESRLLSTVCQGEPILSGGVPAAWDGVHMSEVGFHYYPALKNAAGKNGAGALTPSATPGSSVYSIVATYEWIDARGVRHVSARSNPVSVTMAATDDTIDVDVLHLTLTEHDDPDASQHPVYIYIWRTVSNGEVYYFDQRIANNTRGDVVTATLLNSDATIEANEKLYTTGEVLDNDTPPALRYVTRHADRLWAVSAENTGEVWCSKLIRANSVMPGWSLAFVLRSEVGGETVALASLDSALVVFRERAIWAVTGDGPNDTGGGSDIRLRPLSVETGCRDARSVVSVPDGVLFQGGAGIYAITRGLDVTFMGAPVEDTLGSAHVTSATLWEDRNVVIFTLDTGTDALVYHYVAQEWATWTHATTAYAATLSNGDYYTLDSAGQVHVMHDGTYADGAGTTYPTMTISTPWVHVGGIQGFSRVRRVSLLGEYRSRSDVTVKLYHDRESTAATTYTWTAAQIAAAAKYGRIQIVMHVARQKCSSVRIEIITTADSAVGGDPGDLGYIRWESAILEAAGKPGVFRLPSAARK